VFPEIFEDFMSSAVISTTAAQGRFFVLDADFGLIDQGRHLEHSRSIQSTIDLQQSKILASVMPASRFEARPAPEMVASGIAAIDALTGGLPRGCLTEICGPASSGRTTLLLAALAAATRRGEFCAVVDAGDTLDPRSVAAAGIELERLLWVRCGENLPRRHSSTETKNSQGKKNSKFDKDESHSGKDSLEQLLRATDLLLESGGFGLIVFDLADVPPMMARRIPLTTWFRFRRAVEHTPTVLLAIEKQSIAGSCSSLLLKLAAAGNRAGAQNHACMTLTHTQLLTGLEIKAEVVRSRMDRDRKPARSAEITFASKTAWAG
jgi:hypothetical protein